MRLRGLLAVMVLLPAASAADADSTGISGRSKTGCAPCHGAVPVPLAVIGGPTVVAPNTVHTYTLTIFGGREIAGGLDVSTDDGALGIIDPGTRLLGGEVTHTSPRQVDGNGDVIFVFNWTAPATPGPYHLFGAGSSVNLNGSSTGDLWDTDVLEITVQAAAGTPGETSKDGDLSPLLAADYDELTGDIDITFQTACETTDNNIYYGLLSQVSSYGYSGGVCAIGTGGTATFNPGSDSYFFVVVGTKGADEGSYGLNRLPDISQNERPPYTLNTCGETQTLVNRCD